jgi:hypothetical protein
MHMTQTACDVISEILHQSEDIVRYKDLLQFMVPRVLSLVPQYGMIITSFG